MAYIKHLWTTNKETSAKFNAATANEMEQGIYDAHLMTAPVDCTSRVAEYTGDGIPLIPDSVAGRTYYKNKDFIDTTGWAAGSGVALTVESSMLKIVPSTPGITNIYLESPTYQNKTLSVIIKSSIPLTNITTITGSTVYSQMSVQNLGGNRYLATIYWSRSTLNALHIWPDYGLTTSPTWYLETIYIGTGAYDYQNKDRAGNGNSLTLNAVTPVNGKYCKEMSFNGFTSFGVDKSPIVGTSGTLIMRWKRNRVGTAETLISNQSTTTNGLRYHIDASNNLYAIIGGSSPVSILIKSGFTDTTSSHAFGIKFSATSATPFYDGVEGTAVSATQVLGLANFAIGRNQIASTEYASGQGFYRYDSRIWTADEARAWSLNPISIDSRM